MQTDRQVEREPEADEAGLLVAHEPPVGEHTLRDGRPLRPPSRWLARACWRGWRGPGARLESTRRARRRSAPAAAPPGRGFEAGLHGVRPDLSLEQQRQLPIARVSTTSIAASSAVTAPFGVPDRVSAMANRRTAVANCSGSPAQLDRLGEVGDAARCAEAQLGGAELEEHLRPGFGWWGLRQGTSEPGDGGGGRATGERVGGHPAQELDPPGVTGRLGLDDLGGDPFLRRAACLEDPGGTGVGRGELAWADVGPHGLSHDRVGELQARPPA